MRRGNSRFIIDLMARGVITHVATNGACAIHDFELAHIGATLEDVEDYIRDGKFGNWEETGRYLNEAIVRGYEDRIGFGEAIGRLIQEGEQGIPFPHRDVSMFAAASRLGVPFTVHKGIGYDIIDQHPSADYAAMGWDDGRGFPQVCAQRVSIGRRRFSQFRFCRHGTGGLPQESLNGTQHRSPARRGNSAFHDCELRPYRLHRFPRRRVAYRCTLLPPPQKDNPYPNSKRRR